MVPAGPLFDSAMSRAQCMMRFESRLRFDPHQSAVFRMIDAGSRAIRDRLHGGHRHHHHHQDEDAIGSELGISDIIYKTPSDTAWRNAWHVTEGLIEKMHREVKAHGAAFLTVTLTNGIQVWPDAAAREQYMKRLGVDSLSYPDDRIAALGERDGFPVLVLSKPMAAYAEEHHVFLHGFTNTKTGEGHWNELGHQIGGDLIAAKLCQMMESGQVPALSQKSARK
jgi:hypothetical protein